MVKMKQDATESAEESDLEKAIAEARTILVEAPPIRRPSVTLMQTLAAVAALAGSDLAFDMSDPELSLRHEKELTHGDRERLRLAQEKRDRKAARLMALQNKARR